MAGNELHKKVFLLAQKYSQLFNSYNLLSKLNTKSGQRIHTTVHCLGCNPNTPNNKKIEKNEETKKGPIAPCNPSLCCRPSLKDILSACYANKICSIVAAILFPLTIVTLLLVLADALFNFIDCMEDNLLDSERPCTPPRKVDMSETLDKCSLKEIFYLALILGLKIDKKELERPICQNVINEDCPRDNSKNAKLDKLNKNLEKIIYFCWKKTDRLVCRKATKEEEEKMESFNRKQCVKTKISSSQTENEFFSKNEKEDDQKQTKGNDKLIQQSVSRPKVDKGELATKGKEAQRKTTMEKDVITSKSKDSSSITTIPISPKPPTSPGGPTSTTGSSSPTVPSKSSGPNSSKSTSGSSGIKSHETVQEDQLQSEIKKIEESVMIKDKHLTLPLGIINLIALLIILLTMTL